MSYEKYPVRIVIQSSIHSLAIYALGFSILYPLGIVWALLFLTYIIAVEYRLLRAHCTNCFYWGKRCAFGRGKLSALFFKKGDANKFCAKQMTWADLIPDMLITLVPLIVGIIWMIIDFSFMRMTALVALMLLTTMGNGYVRGALACNHCKQRELGCPAQQLFNKEKSERRDNQNTSKNSFLW